MPDAPLEFLDVWNDRTLIGFLHDIRSWHGNIHVLGLKHLRDVVDVPLENLIIVPKLSDQPVSAEDIQAGTPIKRVPLSQRIRGAQRPLVVLGEAGSGKSTMVDWLASSLAAPMSNLVSLHLGRMVPLPMVLRELDLPCGPYAFDDLLAAFLRRPVAEKLRDQGALLADLTRRGQLLICLDGLDDVGDAAARRRLRDAIQDGVARWPQARWIITSRAVGYDEVPIDGDVTHLAPLDDKDVEGFAHAWFRLREPSAGQSRIQSFLQAVHLDKAVLQMARNPQLLTLLANVFRVRTMLPNSRAGLYDAVAKTWLESNDLYRGSEAVPGTTRDKMRWLGLLAFRMQSRRSEPSKPGETMLSTDDAVGWLAEAIGGPQAKERATSFFGHVGRRNGLFLPRGDDKFTFIHLSFQEFFAAVHLDAAVRSNAWQRGKPTSPGTTRQDLRKCLTDLRWLETLRMLYERASERQEDMAEVLWTELFKWQGPGLVARVSTNSGPVICGPKP